MAVRDSRNRKVAGIYTRNARFYGQLWREREDGTKTATKFSLLTADGIPVSNLNEAKEAMEVARHGRRERTLPLLGHKPGLFDYIETYFAKAETQKKRPATIESERQALNRWKAHLGDLRVDRIERPMIASFIDKRLHAGTSPRTVNLDQIALRNVLNSAKDDGYIRELPPTKSLRYTPPPKRRLMTPAEFERLLAAIPDACRKNGVQFRDYLQFLAYSGAREQEALRIRWTDVDLENEKVTIGADGLAKNHERREVEFNTQLGELLRDMETRRAPDCSWLFPSPQRGKLDKPARKFRESLHLTRAKAGFEWIAFHDLRHFFASFCVMAGLDFMTIAAWLGHKDGGILVGKVYGHLLEDHRRQAARKVSFRLAVLPQDERAK